MTSSPGTLSGADLKSILAADIGSTRTRVALFEQRGDGSWVVQASADSFTTAQSPREGMLGGVLTATRQAAQMAGRTLLTADGQLLIDPAGRRGVDAFVSSGSVAPPLRIIILATTAQLAGTWAREAATWSQVLVEDVAALDAGVEAGYRKRWADENHPNGRADVEKRLTELAPDAVLVAGGSEGGAVAPLLEIAKLLAELRPLNRPPLTVVFAGNAQAAPHVVRLLAGRAEVRVVDNLLPQAGVPVLQPAGEALDDLYCERKLSAVRGHDALRSLSAAPMLSTARALAIAWGVLAEALNAPVLGLDSGAANTVAGLVAPGEGYALRVLPEMGASRGWDSDRCTIAQDDIIRWLPLALSRTDVQTRLAARQERMFALPVEDDGLLFQEALVRELWRTVLHMPAPRSLLPAMPATPLPHIVGSGGVVAHAPNRWRSALVLLDSVEPRGAVHLWVDRAGVLPQLGAVAALHRETALALVRGNALRYLGMAIGMEGETTPGSKAADVELQLPNGSTRRTIVAWGSIHLINTGGLNGVQLRLTPVSGVYVPGHEGERTVRFEVNGGELGVVVDCRQRPLAAQLDSGHSHTRMRAWLAAGEG